MRKHIRQPIATNLNIAVRVTDRPSPGSQPHVVIEKMKKRIKKRVVTKTITIENMLFPTKKYDQNT